MVTAKLVYAFVFAYANCWFSDAASQIQNSHFLSHAHSISLFLFQEAEQQRAYAEEEERRLEADRLRKERAAVSSD